MSSDIEREALQRLCDTLNDASVKKLIADRVFLADQLAKTIEERDEARRQRDTYKRDQIVTRRFFDTQPAELAKRVKELEAVTARFEREFRKILRDAGIDDGSIEQFINHMKVQ